MLTRETAISGSIGVDLATLATAEEDFQQAVNALRAELDLLDSQLTASLSEWSGEAQAAYQAAHARWQAAAADMVATLAWLHRVVGTARQNYQSARLTNLGIWKGRG